ncbi:precorrin-2 C(20)-methyltransferase [Neptunomonas sp. XY-337]|uniref:precorrin-2 C(20)-methyltransferase n=1 Tax=Neptunomonas sp. XY-337 TaxID=2561897 RepID=UPI0010AAC76B|nr:precorrin-2 C(20)-methyltransferase [Neptunomonas sp. XY-337]
MGKLIGVGVGPGDPELLTLKAARLIEAADLLVYLSNEAGDSTARHIARIPIAQRPDNAAELALVMPMKFDRSAANAVYDEAALQITDALTNGQLVVFLCEGDPLIFGSFSYLLERLAGRFACEVVPGISSINGACAAVATPLTRQSESFAVVSGRQSLEQLTTALTQHAAVVILKAGQARPKILAALNAANRSRDAQYLEYIGRENERIVRDVSTLTAEAGPYFSMFLVTQKPEAACASSH